MLNVSKKASVKVWQSWRVIPISPLGLFEPTIRLSKKKVTWVADDGQQCEVILAEFDHLISKAKLEDGEEMEDFLNTNTKQETLACGEAALRTVQENTILQLERRGYYRVERPYISAKKPMVLYMIPDGKVKAMSTLSTKMAHR